MLFWFTCAVMGASVLLGGATAVGSSGDVIVQMLAAPLLVICAREWVGGMAGKARWSFADTVICMSLAGLCLILIVQLAPWPPSVLSAWRESLPGPDVPAAALEQPLEEHWHGISATPHLSWAAAVSLIPCLAVFFAVARLDPESRFRLSLIVCLLGVLSLAVGFLQMLQGPASQLRFYEITNPSEPVGFFANRNHFAALLYIALVFSSIWLALAARDFASSRFSQTHAILWFIFATILVLSILTAIALARSRAGVILSCAALAGIFAIFLAGRRNGERGKKPFRLRLPGLATGTVVLAFLFTLQFGLHRLVARFESDPLQDLRAVLTPATFDIAIGYLPLGSGLGSFERIYSNHERTDHLFNGYVNRAHNDWAEIFLETGLLGAAAILAFLTWFAWRAVQIVCFRSPAGNHHQLILQRGAVLAVALLLAHSLVDYPLRTTAMSVLFMFSCALLVDPQNAKATVRTKN